MSVHAWVLVLEGKARSGLSRLRQVHRVRADHADDLQILVSDEASPLPLFPLCQMESYWRQENQGAAETAKEASTCEGQVKIAQTSKTLEGKVRFIRHQLFCDLRYALREGAAEYAVGWMGGKDTNSIMRVFGQYHIRLCARTSEHQPWGQ